MVFQNVRREEEKMDGYVAGRDIKMTTREGGRKGLVLFASVS